MSDLSFWQTICDKIAQSANGSESSFWIKSLSWIGAVEGENQKTIINLEAPTVHYVSLFNASLKGEIERASTELVGRPCEVRISPKATAQINTFRSTPTPQTTTSIYSNPPQSSGHVAPTPRPSPFDSPIPTVTIPKSRTALRDAIFSDEPTEFRDPLAPPRPEDRQMPPPQAFVQGGLNSPQSQIRMGRNADIPSDLNTIDPNLTFDNYIVGPSNQFAYANAYVTSEKPAQQFNPLFIYGPPAVGKTHLLHAIGNRLKTIHPHLKSYFVSAEAFVNEFVESIKSNKQLEFREKYRQRADVLLIDDFQFIVGKDRSQEEFVHTFNALHHLKKMVVLTSDKAPKDIDGLEERIRTRFEMGLVTDIRPPEIETRIAILKSKAEKDDWYLPDEVATFIGTYVKDTVRGLHGALIRLQQHASMSGSEITLDLAKQALQDTLPEEGQEYTVDNILNAICKVYQIKLRDLKGGSRAKLYSLPRQVSMYLIRRYTHLGYREIGMIFSKDHSTAVHACKAIDRQIEIDSELRRSVDAIRMSL